MSKERELLNRSRYNLDREYCADLIDEIQELLAQPEQEQEPVAWMQDSVELYVLEEKSAIRGYVIPLYTAPQKRKPLTGKEIAHGFRANDDATHAYSYWAGVDFAEKAHGIGGGEC